MCTDSKFVARVLETADDTIIHCWDENDWSDTAAVVEDGKTICNDVSVLVGSATTECSSDLPECCDACGTCDDDPSNDCGNSSDNSGSIDYIGTDHAILQAGGNYTSATRNLYLPANDIPGLFENDAQTVLEIAGGKAQVKVHLTPNVYDDDQYQCSLHVTPSLSAGASSATFQTAGHHTAFAESKDETPADNFLSVEVPAFAAENNRVGLLAADLDISVKCQDPLNALANITISLYANDVASGGTDGQKARIRRSMETSLDSQDDWQETSALSLSPIIPLWASRSHAKLPLQIGASSTVKLVNDILYPEGEWDTFVKGSAATYVDTITCSHTGVVKSQYQQIQDWHNASNTFSADFAYGEATDSCTTGVCSQRQHVSTVAWGTNN